MFILTIAKWILGLFGSAFMKLFGTDKELEKKHETVGANKTPEYDPNRFTGSSDPSKLQGSDGKGGTGNNRGSDFR